MKTEKEDKTFLETMIPIWFSAFFWFSVLVVGSTIFGPMVREIPMILQQVGQQLTSTDPRSSQDR